MIFAKHFTINRLLWAVYLALLGVLLPHTAWAFNNFEPAGAHRWSLLGVSASPVAWVASFAFEAAIAALTHRLSKHIEAMPRVIHTRKAKFHPAFQWWPVFAYRYANAYTLGLVSALGVSSLANLAHAVEFGGQMTIFTEWKIPFGVYAMAFGAILPAVSLIFARVLSNVAETELEEDPAIVEAKAKLAELRHENKELRRSVDEANIARRKAEERFEAVGDLVVKLFAEDKRQKILAASQLWPQLPGAAIAIIAGASPSYVSETLKVDEVIEDEEKAT